MRLVLANHSSYPRVGNSKESQRVRRAYAQRETGAVDDAGYREVVHDYVREIIAEQQEAGLDLVTDGQVGWYDLVVRLAGNLDGTEIDGLHRFFDTNYLVRRPEIVGSLSGSFGLADDWRHASSVAAGEVKAVLTGPYTLACHSIRRSDDYPDLGSLAMAFAEATARELAELKAGGARLVQLEEPSLLRSPEDAPLVRRVLARALEGKGELKVSLVTYFGPATPILGEIAGMGADMLGFDLAYDPGVADAVAAQGLDVPVALGAIDGRNTKLDDPEPVARTVERVMEALGKRGVEEVHLQPSCGLEYLPRDRALRKLERMREIANLIEKVGA